MDDLQSRRQILLHVAVGPGDEFQRQVFQVFKLVRLDEFETGEGGVRVRGDDGRRGDAAFRRDEFENVLGRGFFLLRRAEVQKIDELLGEGAKVDEKILLTLQDLKVFVS